MRDPQGLIVTQFLRQPIRSIPVLESRGDESPEKRVSRGWLALEFGVELHRDKEGVTGDLNEFSESTVGRGANEMEARILKLAAVVLIELVAMAVTLVDRGVSVELGCAAVLGKLGLPSAKPHAGAHVRHLFLLFK